MPSRRVLRKDLYFRETGYVPHAGQHDIHYTPARFKVLRCGRRWGKTICGGKEAEPNAFVLNRLGQPQTGWIVGPNYVDGEKEFRVVYDSLRKQGVDKHSVKFVKNAESGNLHIITEWGFDLQVRSAAKPETLVGEGLDFVLMVEAGRLKRATWGDYVRPALSDKRGWGFFSGVPEGSSLHSLLYQMYQRGQSSQFPHWASWKRPSWTNNIVFPGGRMDPEILDAEADLTEDEFARQYGAEFVEKSGSVMKEWDDDFHLADLKYRKGWPLFGAVDYGFTNPFVWLWVQVDPLNGYVHVLRERRWQMLDTEEIAKDMLSNPIDAAFIRAMVRFYPDPAEPDDTRTLMRKFRKPAVKETGGELKTRLALIRQHLKPAIEGLPLEHDEQRPKMYVDRSCTQLAWEMREGYRWPEHRSEVRNDKEHPLDKDNHGVEALGRFMRGYYGSPSTEKRRPGQSKAKIGG